ncbi:MAG: hypothetical protein V3U15_01300, partial [Nitrospinota bacterium]
MEPKCNVPPILRWKMITDPRKRVITTTLRNINTLTRKRRSLSKEGGEAMVFIGLALIRH